MADIHHNEPERHEERFDATPVGHTNLVNLGRPTEAARPVDQTADKFLAKYESSFMQSKSWMSEDAGLRNEASKLASFDNAKKLMVTSV
jgi:hypothetical protein